MNFEGSRSPEKKKRKPPFLASAALALSLAGVDVSANEQDRNRSFEGVGDPTAEEGFDSVEEFAAEFDVEGIQAMNGLVLEAARKNSGYTTTIKEMIIPDLPEEMTPEQMRELDTIVEDFRSQLQTSREIADSAGERLDTLLEFYAPRLEKTDDGELKATIEKFIRAIQAGPGVYVETLETSIQELETALEELEAAREQIKVEAQEI